jgi:hypothetical protein
MWVLPAVILAGIGAIAGGVLWTRADRFRGVILAVFGLAFLIIASPMMVLDRVEISGDRLYLNTGFWFSPTRHEIHFSEVSRAEVEVEVKESRSGPVNSYGFVFYLKSGQKERVPIGDLMKQAYREILAATDKHHIPVQIPANMEAFK